MTANPIYYLRLIGRRFYRQGLIGFWFPRNYWYRHFAEDEIERINQYGPPS